MTFAKLFQDNFGNLPPIVRALAKWADEKETNLERIRIKIGFLEDWSPSYDRRQRSGVSAPIKWVDKAAGMNGIGDLRALVEEMCGWADAVDAKEAEVLAMLDDQEKPQEAPASCPKCGKTGRGIKMHMKHCQGK